jgi:flagellar basal-body rod protein FlgF
MIRGIYFSARGMSIESIKQDVISNNLANVNTNGFKKDTVAVQSFSEYLLRVQQNSGSRMLGAVNQSPLIDSIVTRYDMGMLEQTGKDTDFAITGEGFFVIQTPQGLRYTRDGSFHLDREGYLVTAEGHYVLNTAGDPIESGSGTLVVDSHGVIRDGIGSLIGQMQIAGFTREQQLQMQKQGHNLFAMPEGIMPAQLVGTVQQHAVERSNVDVIREMVEMITVTRMYEANQKSVQTQDELLGKSINEVGRVR